ncbi:MAG: copper amine oxidase N-terminal domain-containing protein [Syntrophomonadaceae bacterium]|nr:copper amine oxidase N-terminal domain-containing protein [Syntrophomonadaceae bacterium]
MKKIVNILVLCTLMTLIGQNFLLANDDEFRRHNVKIRLYSQEIVFPDSQPYIDTLGDRLYIPLPYLIEFLGGVYFTSDEDKNASLIYYKDSVIEISGNSSLVKINGEEKTLPRPLILYNDEIAAPAAFITQCLDYQVDWDAGTRHMVIYK